jgi:hypothetical protein
MQHKTDSAGPASSGAGKVQMQKTDIMRKHKNLQIPTTLKLFVLFKFPEHFHKIAFTIFLKL